MKEIPLTQGRVALVDDWNYERLSQFKWLAVNYRGRFYAARSVRKSGQNRLSFLHHRVLVRKAGLEIDHKNGNSLDNREENLRYATRVENLRNSQKSRRPRTSRFKGVSKFRNKWVAHITHNGRRISLGVWTSERHAAAAYNLVADGLWGEFASLNVLD